MALGRLIEAINSIASFTGKKNKINFRIQNRPTYCNAILAELRHCLLDDQE